MIVLENFSPLFSDLRDLCAFARDIPAFGCGYVALCSLWLILFPSCLSAQEPLRAGTIFSATQAPLWAAKEASTSRSME